MKPKITRIRIQNMKSIEDITLDLRGLTVLIGDNGSGKSTILEALTILQKVMTGGRRKISEVLQIHGGFSGLVRHGAESIVLAIEMSVGLRSCAYGIKLKSHSEKFQDTVILDRIEDIVDGGFSEENNFSSLWLSRELLQLNLLKDNEEYFHEAKDFDAFYGAIEDIKNFPFFQIHSQWSSNDLNQMLPIRQPVVKMDVDSLDVYGRNLANAYLRMHEDEGIWREALELLRLGLGQDLEDVLVSSVGKEKIRLSVKFESLPEEISIDALSDGQVAYMCFVAMKCLSQGKGLVTFDEPELHLHPATLLRVISMFEEMAEEQPVILSTHSDRILDLLNDPVNSVVLCELDEKRRTVLKRVDQKALELWLEDYRGIGQLRSEGYDQMVFKPA